MRLINRLCAILLLFLALITNDSFPSAFPENDQEVIGEKLFYTLRNRDARMEDRQNAVKELLKMPSADLRSEFLRILYDQNESRILHQYVSDSIAEWKDKDMLEMLNKIVKDQKSDRYVRDVALSILWKTNVEDALPLMRQAAENRYETDTFRTRALAYLHQSADNERVKEMAYRILLDEREKIRIRKAALNLLLIGGEIDNIKKLFEETYMDSGKSAESRKFAILISRELNFPDLEANLMRLIAEPKEDAGVKEAAFVAFSQGEEQVLRGFREELKRLYDAGPHLGISQNMRIDIKKLMDQLNHELES